MCFFFPLESFSYCEILNLFQMNRSLMASAHYNISVP